MLKCYINSAIIFIIIIFAFIFIVKNIEEINKKVLKRLKIEDTYRTPKKRILDIIQGTFVVILVSFIPFIRILVVLALFQVAFLNDEEYEKVWGKEK